MAGTSNLDTIEEYSEGQGSSHRSLDGIGEHYNYSDEDLAYLAESQRSTRRKVTKRRKKNKVDMTPPDKLLIRSKKKARTCLSEGDHLEGVRELLKCTALARIVYGDNHWQYARSYAELAQAYLDHLEYIPQAEHYSSFAKSLLMAVNHNSEEMKLLSASVLASLTLGRALAALQKYTAAEAELKNTDRLCREMERLDPRDAAEWAIKLNIARAKLCTKQQKYANSLRYYERSLRLVEEQFGQDSEELVPIYQGMGRVQMMNNQEDEAIRSYLQAHSVTSSVHKGGGAEVSETAVELARAYTRLETPDGYSAAEGYYDEALSLSITLYGFDDVKVLQIKDEKAQVFMKSQQHEEAVQLLKETLDLKKDKFGEFSLEVADTWKMIANAYLAMAEFVKAADAFKRCHKIESELLTKNHKRAKDTQRSIDILLKNPQVSAKFKTKEDELQERPRFNSIVNRGAPVGGFKSSL